ncbi:MAG: threonine synthase [Limnochordaceae bacterium]|nr:threonine synthase [Limnochordaceae bacterium]
MERARRLLTPFLPDLAPAQLDVALRQAYAAGQWGDPRITPVHPLANSPAAFLELWHGPTCAFKDVALQLLPHLLKAAAGRPQGQPQVQVQADLTEPGFPRSAAQGQPAATGGAGTDVAVPTQTTATVPSLEPSEIVVLVATSGDTGKAALAGFADVPGTQIIVFYPAEGVSPIQERQMTTQTGKNVHVIGVWGNFDDAQTGVKKLFTDAAFKARLFAHNKAFSSANSINWGRLLPQIVYYVGAYVDLVSLGRLRPGEPFNVVVPTGNFGNILAAHYARRLGLPIARLICASNRNNVLTDFFHTGRYDRRRPFYRTSSPSMDILISSNLERLLFELVQGDSDQLRAWMDALARHGTYEISQEQVARIQAEFWADWADEEQTQAAIARTWREHHYLIDPHTAVAVHVYDHYRAATGDDRPTVIASTASPFKFPRTVASALELPMFPSPGVAAPGSLGLPAPASSSNLKNLNDFDLLERLATFTDHPVPPALQRLNRRPVLHTQRCTPAEMPSVVAQVLGV